MGLPIKRGFALQQSFNIRRGSLFFRMVEIRSRAKGVEFERGAIEFFVEGDPPQFCVHHSRRNFGRLRCVQIQFGAIAGGADADWMGRAGYCLSVHGGVGMDSMADFAFQTLLLNPNFPNHPTDWG